MTDELGAISFAEKILALLDQGRFTATYKYAVLLGLIDLCLEGVSRAGRAPQMVTTHQLAEKVVELYWPHTAPFPRSSTPRVLHQNRGGKAEILTLILAFRASVGDSSMTLARARALAPEAWRTLLRDVEWKLVEMPLPRLQWFGVAEERFIYQIDWDRSVRRREFLDERAFSNAIRLVDGAGDHLVHLAGLLRPLLQRRWAADVARMNPDLIEDAALEDWLFGTDRIALRPVLDGLRELQGNRCFYCQERLERPQVDHFIPWARVPMNAIENLVIADAKCNHGKREHLAAAEHVEAWAMRSREDGPNLLEIARHATWEQGADRVLGVARATYLLLRPSSRLWLRVVDPAKGEQLFIGADLPRLTTALVS
jgi:hypothetical protein